MRRKTLSPSNVRRCALFLMLGSLACVGSASGGMVQGNSSSNNPNQPLLFQQGEPVLPAFSVSNGVGGQDQSVDPLGPGLTGENWFANLQERINAPKAAAGDKAAAAASAAQERPVTATAIPSPISFWSGLWCCVGLVLLGMIPRVRRALR